MNINFKVVFYLQGRQNKDGKTTILYRIYLGTDRLAMGSIGFSIDASQWSSRTGRVSGSSAEARHINSMLDTVESDLRTIFRRMEFSENLSLERIRSEYLRRGEKAEEQTFVGYVDAYIAKRAEEVGHGLSESSLQKYKVTRRRFVEYLTDKYKRKDLRFSELNYTILSGFEHYLKTANMMVNNTAMRMLKTLKTIVLEARREGLIKVDPYLNIRMHMDPVDRGFLTDEELQRMMSYDFDIKRLEQVRDMFIFSCFTGLAYADLSKLTYDEIVEINGRKWIVSRRQKTNVSCHVPLLDIPLRIMEKYRGKTKDNKVLPIISNQKTNAFLKEIAAVCGIEKNLTCHLARHTFATMSLSKNVSIESVSKMLGHTNIKTTQIYARITNKKVENDMEMLAQQLHGFDDKMANMGKKESKKVAPFYNEPPVIVDNPIAPLPEPTADKTPDEKPATVAKKRGRPRKTFEATEQPIVEQPAKKRGRPRKNPVEAAEPQKPAVAPAAQPMETLTPQIIDGKMVIKTPDGRTFVIGEEISAPTPMQETAVETKKRGRPRKVQTEETPKAKPSSTAYVDGKFVTTQEPPMAENKKRQRIPRGVKVETPIVRQARRR